MQIFGSVVFSYGLWPSFLLIVYCWLLAMANSQWYAIVRTLINDSMLWWLLPVAFYALLLVPMVLLDGAAGDLFLQAVTMPGEQIAYAHVFGKQKNEPIYQYHDSGICQHHDCVAVWRG